MTPIDIHTDGMHLRAKFRHHTSRCFGGNCAQMHKSTLSYYIDTVHVCLDYGYFRACKMGAVLFPLEV